MGADLRGSQKIVASDVLMCEMANRKVELRILTFQSAFHSLAGFTGELGRVRKRRVFFEALRFVMGCLAQQQELPAKPGAERAHA